MTEKFFKLTRAGEALWEREKNIQFIQQNDDVKTGLNIMNILQELNWLFDRKERLLERNEELKKENKKLKDKLAKLAVVMAE